MDISKFTFDEYCRNRDKYLGKEDEQLGYIDAGSQNLKKRVQKQIYEIEGYRCKTLEEVERVARDRGIPLRELDYRPHVVPQSGGKCDILVRFLPKHTRDKRNAWG